MAVDVWSHGELLARPYPALLRAPLLPARWGMPVLGSRAVVGAFPAWLPAWETKFPTKARASGKEQGERF